MRQLILILVLANSIIYTIIFDFLKEERLVLFLDIGQGEAVLIKNNKNTYLYDTGKYPPLILKEIDKVLPFYDRKIDILFLSHPDKDHYFSAQEILKRYEVRIVGVSVKQSNDRNYEELLALVRRLNTPILIFRRGDKIFDNHFHFLVLHPDKIYKKDNNNSLVIKISGKNSYLLTGDIENEAINSLIYCCEKFLRADYFLVPHHGSRYSVDKNFYSLIKGDTAIIQVGFNFYGHPHPETLSAIKEFFPHVWRTDINKLLTVKE
ncbi:MAG: MBL fold hydrolase [Candidatus Parcubacteria bacterium]|nr:MAG: MBL fold hydrolase [Candidatus Parcubacteria bacterium]